MEGGIHWIELVRINSEKKYLFFSNLLKNVNYQHSGHPFSKVIGIIVRSFPSNFN